MKIKLVILFSLLNYLQAHSCSMYKITLFGKTFVGNNEDYCNPASRIWFEKGKTNEYGSVFVGFDDLYAQGGMNEKGLVFDGFSVNTPEVHTKPNKLPYYHTIAKDVLKKCQNVDEVYDLLYQYDLSALKGAMLLFVDKSGSYLIIELDTMIKGNDSKYLLSNFCPSKTSDLSSVKIPFIRKEEKCLMPKQTQALPI